jgi:hypothetical protein
MLEHPVFNSSSSSHAGAWQHAELAYAAGEQNHVRQPLLCINQQKHVVHTSLPTNCLPFDWSHHLLLASPAAASPQALPS